jgi:hypothetical protein
VDDDVPHPRGAATTGPHLDGVVHDERNLANKGKSNRSVLL